MLLFAWTGWAEAFSLHVPYPSSRTLLDNEADMFDRYGALFALRERAAAPNSGEEHSAAVEAIVSALHGSTSALLSHEVSTCISAAWHEEVEFGAFPEHLRTELWHV